MPIRIRMMDGNNSNYLILDAASIMVLKDISVAIDNCSPDKTFWQQ